MRLRNRDLHATPDARHFVGQIVVRQLGFLPSRVLGSGFCRQRFFRSRSQGRLHDAQQIEHRQRQAETEQGRLGISQRVDFASQRSGQVLERGFDVPAVQVRLGRLGRPHLGRQICQQMHFHLALAGRLIAGDGDPSHREVRAVLSPQQQGLFVDHARAATTNFLPLPLQFSFQGAVLPHEKVSLAVFDSKQEFERAEVGVGHPALLLQNPLQQSGKQRPLIGVAVLAGDDILQQLPLRIEHHHRMPGQGSGRPCVATLPADGRCRPGDCRRRSGSRSRAAVPAHAAEFVDDHGQIDCRFPNEAFRDGGFDASQLIVDSLYGEARSSSNRAW